MREAGLTTTINIQPGCPTDCKFLLPLLDLETQQAVGRFKASFSAFLKTHQVREHEFDWRPQMKCSQGLTVRTKMDSVCTRLNRIREETDAARNPDELRRRKGLFECMFLPVMNDHGC